MGLQLMVRCWNWTGNILPEWAPENMPKWSESTFKIIHNGAASVIKQGVEVKSTIKNITWQDAKLVNTPVVPTGAGQNLWKRM